MHGLPPGESVTAHLGKPLGHGSANPIQRLRWGSAVIVSCLHCAGGVLNGQCVNCAREVGHRCDRCREERGA